jgi:hypothetical protein
VHSPAEKRFGKTNPSFFSSSPFPSFLLLFLFFINFVSFYPISHPLTYDTIFFLPASPMSQVVPAACQTSSASTAPAAHP